MKTTFNESPEFSKEFKRFAKKYKSLFIDLKEFERVVDIAPLGNSKHFNILIKNERCVIVKARLFCRYLKGSSLRIIYAFHGNRSAVVFVEVYFKSEKENENQERIKKYLENFG